MRKANNVYENSHFLTFTFSKLYNQTVLGIYYTSIFTITKCIISTSSRCWIRDWQSFVKVRVCGAYLTMPSLENCNYKLPARQGL